MFLGTLYAGGRVVLSSTPSPDDCFPLIEKERVTITALVPPLAMVWMDASGSRSDDLSSLQVLQVGGAKFSAEAARRVKSAFGVHPSAGFRNGGRIGELYETG